MFRTSYVHHQEDYVAHTVLYGMFFVGSSGLKDVHIVHTA